MVYANSSIEAGVFASTESECTRALNDAVQSVLPDLAFIPPVKKRQRGYNDKLAEQNGIAVHGKMCRKRGQVCKMPKSLHD